MPNSYKNILIRNVLNIRFEYYKFYIENTYIHLDWQVDKDDMYWNNNYMQCGNYLDEIASGLNVYNKNINGIPGLFGSQEERVINNKYSDNHLSEGNYVIPVGSSNSNNIFKKDIWDIGITIRFDYLNWLVHNSDNWKNFHTQPFEWSKKHSYDEHDFNADNTMKLASNASLRQLEIDKYIALYNLKRKYALNTKEEEAKQMYFNYHMGNHQEAYNHLQRFLFLEYGNFKGLIDYIKNTEGYIVDFSTKDMHIGIAAALLFMENKEFEKALELTNIIVETNQSKYLNSSDNTEREYYYRPLISAAYKISNKIHYQMGNYDKMLLQKDEDELNILQAKAESIFNFSPRKVSGIKSRKESDRRYNIKKAKLLNNSKRQYLEYMDPYLQASALLKLGNSRLAKAVLEDVVKYYTKKDKNSPRIFYGSQLDIDVFKETVKALFPGKEDNIKYGIGNLDLFGIRLESQKESPIKYLTKFTLQTPKYMNKELIDLNTKTQWSVIKESLNNHNGTKEELLAIFNNLNEIFTTYKLESNKESQFFLINYVQFAMVLGKFHEAIPAMFELDNDYPNHGLNLEHNLLKLMWPQKQNDLNKKFEDEKTGLYTKPSLLKTYFDSEVKNSEHLKTSLNNYLSLWSSLKVASPMIPYLYSLYEN
jgi:hypothetical protein